MASSLRAVVVGCGSIGLRHIKNLSAQPAVDVIAVDPDPSRRAAAEELGITAVADVRLVTEADLALVCTPAPDHVRQTLHAVRRGWDVLVEKPVAPTSAEARHLAASLPSDRIVAVGYNLHFEGGVAALREAIRAGSIGRTLWARVEFGQYLPDWRPTRDYRQTVTAQAALGGGILLEGSHELDLLRWLFGEWTAVTSAVRRRSALEIDVEDTVAAIVECEGGTVVELHMDMVRRGYERAVTCIGETGTLTWRFGAGTARIGPDGAIVQLSRSEDANTMYAAEIVAMLDCVRGRTVPAVGIEEGIAALDLVEAIKRSSAEGVRLTR